MARKVIPNLVKKTVSFFHYKLSGHIIKDEASISGKTESAVIEDHLLNDILPSNKEAQFIVTTTLYPENEEYEGDIGDTLTALFRENAAGINWASKHDNLKPIVEFAQHILCVSNHSLLTGQEEIIFHMKSQLDSFVQLLKEKSEQADDFLTKQNYHNGYLFASDLYNELDNHPNGFNILNLFTLILDFWNDVCSWTRTYRLLGDASSVCKWPNQPKYKIHLLYLIKNVSDEWSDDTINVPNKLSATKDISELKQDKKAELLAFMKSISRQDFNYLVSIANDNMIMFGKDTYVDYDAVIKEIESW